MSPICLQRRLVELAELAGLPRRWAGRGGLVVVLALSATGLSGCVARIPAALSRDGALVNAAPVGADAWPARYQRPLRMLTGLSGPAKADGVEATLVSRVTGFYGRGAVTVGSWVVGGKAPALVTNPRELRFVSCPYSTRDLYRLAAEQRRGDPMRALFRTTAFHLLEPTGPAMHGLIVHYGSMGGSKFEEPCVQRLRSDGWTVLRMRGMPEGSLESYTLDADVRNPAATAQTLARILDNRLAEYAYATDGVLAYLREHHPEVPQRPLVLMGYSAGALSVPAAAAYLGSRVDAAVMVGGGANLLEAAQTSTLTNAGLNLRWSATPTDADRRRLFSQYLQMSRLDPYHTAGSLAGKPVLLLHAAFDSIVPASNGELLYQRLARPERWNFAMGHELLFLSLPGQADNIADWLARHARGGSAVAAR